MVAEPKRPTAEEKLADANWERSHEASKRDVARAREAMKSIQRVPVTGLSLPQIRTRQRYMQVLAMRVRYPHATLAQLARASNVNKDIYGARLKRAFKYADALKERYP